MVLHSRGGDGLGVGVEVGHRGICAIFQAMLDNGIYLPPSQYEAAFLSAAHSEEDVAQTIAAAKQAFAAVTR